MNSISESRSDFDKYLIPTYAPAPFIPVRGKGSTVFDQQDKDYIDFVGGIAVNALGHSHSAVKEALVSQAEKLCHMGNGYTNEPVLALAKQLVKHTFADKVFFCNSGAEANEAALKLARKFANDNFGKQKNEVISFEKSFHGRTLFTVSAGGQPKYSEDFAPLPKGIKHAPFNDLEAVAELINENTCAVIVEPIQGEGGVIPATTEFLKGLRVLCDKHNAMLILDEIQTGVGRTGALYSYMQYGVTPDLLSTAKALGGGFPIGAILTTDKFAGAFSPGSHGTTYGGNPLASAVAGKVLSIIAEPKFLAEVGRKHDFFIQQLEAINARFSVFKSLRSAGLLIGCELTEAHQGKAKAITNIAAEEGVLVLIAGPNVLRFAPALNISDEEMQRGLARLEVAIKRYLEA